MKSTVEAVRDIVMSFKGKEMSHAQNMAVFNLIESVFGEKSADAFSKSMTSSDDRHDRSTTYTYNKNIVDVWIGIVQ